NDLEQNADMSSEFGPALNPAVARGDLPGMPDAIVRRDAKHLESAVGVLSDLERAQPINRRIQLFQASNPALARDDLPGMPDAIGRRAATHLLAAVTVL